MSAMPLRYHLIRLLLAIGCTAYVMHAVLGWADGHHERQRRTEHAAHSEEHRR